jgi:hypothetical protein
MTNGKTADGLKRWMNNPEDFTEVEEAYLEGTLFNDDKEDLEDE